MSSVVLDASAILAVLHRERGHEKVTPHLRGGLVSAVNYAEVLKKTVERGTAMNVTQLYLNSLSLVVVPFDERQAVVSAEFWPASRDLGLSLADRACLAAGIVCSAVVYTADVRLAKVKTPVEIKLIR